MSELDQSALQPSRAVRRGPPDWVVAVGSHFRQLTIVIMLALAIGLVSAPAALADCVGYGSEGDRVDAAKENAAFVAFATPTSVVNHARPADGGVPVDVYTFSIVEAVQGVSTGGTAEVAAPQDTSVSRSYILGQSYFLVPSDAARDHGLGTDLKQLAPFVDSACSPTVLVSETSPSFVGIVANRIGVESSPPPVPADAGREAANPDAPESSSRRSNTVVGAAIAAVVILIPTSIFLIRKRRSRTQ